MEDKKKIQGKRLQEVRKILGKTQESFCEWLTEHGITGNYDEPYKQKTIAAWESGRRNVPDDIKKILSDTVTVDGFPVQYAYLNGDTDFITQSTGAIVKHTFEMLKGFNPSKAGQEGSGWKVATSEDIQNMANDPLNRFALAMFDEILPIFNYSRSDIWDTLRFNNYMYSEVRKLIEVYIQAESEGK